MGFCLFTRVLSDFSTTLNALSVAKSPLSVPELFALFYGNYSFNHVLGHLEKS